MSMTAEERIERAICEMADWMWQQEHPNDEGPDFTGELDLDCRTPVLASGMRRDEQPVQQTPQRPTHSL